MSEATSTEQQIPPDKQKLEAEVERKKREAEIKARGAALKAEKDALNKQRNEILAQQKELAKEREQLAEFNKWRSTATTDPDAFLGPVYGKEWRDVLAKHTAGDKTPLEIRQLREEWEKERRERAAQEEKRKEDEKTAIEAKKKAEEEEEEKAFQEYAQDISTRWIEERKDKYPSLYSARLAVEVAKKVRAIHKDTGKMPDEDAVATELEGELDKVLEGVYGTQKWSEKLKAKFTPAPPVRKTEPPSFTVARKAISQDMAAGSKPAEKPLTREQKREKLARMSDEEWSKLATAARQLRAPADGE